MKEKRNKIFIHRLIPVACLIVAVIIVLINFFVNMKAEGTKSVESAMAEVVVQYAEDIYSDLKLVETTGKTTASTLANMNVGNENNIQIIISTLVDNAPIYAAVYNQGEGKGITQDGEKVDLKSCDYYSKVYRVSGVRYFYAKNDGLSGHKAIVLVIPIEGKTYENLILYYSMDRIQKALNTSREFDSESFAALITAKGVIIERGDIESKFLEGVNLWDAVPSEYVGALTRAKVQIRNLTAGCFAVEKGGEARTLVYAPVKVDEWVLVFGVNQDYVEKEKAQYWSTASAMLYQLLIVIIVFLIVLLAVESFARKKSEENDKMLREKADTDLLTGLNNKLATERKIKEYMEENPNALGMMFVLDIDNFKKINDTLGHAFGDEVLRTLGKQIGSVFRVTDIIGRTGGDEFTIFLKFLKNDENTLKEAQKLVKFFEDFKAGEYVKYSATASIGAAVFPAHGQDFESLYKSADKALYKAKQRGKSQLAFYDDRDRKTED